ncbi:MAG: Cullin-3 [Piccolia ochrophora]|nr:MAG: Cullin-3 [Piccolia ochrophora]
MASVRGRGKIRPPRRGLTSPTDNADFDTMWAVLASSLSEIHTKNASKLSFEELYRTAYRLVLKKKGDVLYQRVKKFEEDWLSDQVRSRIRNLLSGSALAGAGGVGGTTVNEKRAAGEKFLKGLKEAWEDHNLCMSMTTDVLMYMDRVYSADHRQPSIFTASMGLFRDHILRSPLDANNSNVNVGMILNSIILDQIQMEREGDVIDKNLIRSCAYMLEGLYESEDEDENEKLYLTSFETEFLNNSQTFYRSEGESMVRGSDASSFIKHANRRLLEEQDRCRSTISPLTAVKIKAVVEQEMIQPYIQDVVDMEGSGAKYMLDNDRFEDLRLLYELNTRVDAKKMALTKAVQKRVVESGTDTNKTATDSTNAVVPSSEPPSEKKEGDGSSKAPTGTAANQQTAAAIKWVDDVLQLKDKYDTIWTQSFDSDQDLQTSLTRSFSEFINAFPRSSEYVSLFIDDNLKRGLKGKTESEVDAVLDKAIVLLRYIQDKDLFERYYKKHLSRRLLMGKSISYEVERQMISRMKMEVGNHFTQKLEGMFRDMTISEELTSGYKSYVGQLRNGESTRVDLGVNVLTGTFWPMETMGPSTSEDGVQSSCVFPPEVERIKNSFENYYLGKHTGRKLTWPANLGSADIRAVFPKVPGKEGALGKERRHELNVSTFMMVVLMLFNDLPSGTSYTFEEIQAKTLIPPNDLIRNLQSLAVAPKTRVLIKDPMSKDIKPTDRFSFNDNFLSKFLKIKVGVVAGGNKVESDRERQETEKKNDENRGGVIEAAVVRIMKQRKELPHQNLFAEVIAQLASRFMPDVNMVKKRLESLIEREYLERIEDAPRPAYRYLA